MSTAEAALISACDLLVLAWIAGISQAARLMLLHHCIVNILTGSSSCRRACVSRFKGFRATANLKLRGSRCLLMGWNAKRL